MTANEPLHTSYQEYLLSNLGHDGAARMAAADGSGLLAGVRSVLAGE